ncbi:MAG: rod shape-determining protein MreC [Acidimicrobiales bacterium]
MAVSRRPARTRYVVVVLVLASITLLTVDARGGGSTVVASLRSGARAVLDPLASATHRALAPVGDFLSGAVDYSSVVADNRRLRSQVASMQAAQAQAHAGEAEARQVLDQAHLDFAAGVPQVAAQVVSQSSANFEGGFQINRGTSSGIAAGYPVVTAGGLVGAVSSAGAHDATITLLTDSTFVVGVAVPASAAVGVVSGYGPRSPLRVADIPAGTAVPKGAVLSTSGLQGERFPPGIPVGRVTAASTPAGSLSESVTLAPLVPPLATSVVQVLVWSPQTLPGP